MAQIEISLPPLAEGIIEAEITRWLVSEGDRIEAEQPVVEIATDKVDSEVPAASAGILVKILIAEGETAKIGQVLAILETDPEAYTGSTPDEQSGSEPKSTGVQPDGQEYRPHTDASPAEQADVSELAGNRISSVISESAGYGQAFTSPHPDHTHFLSPYVRRLIKEYQLNDEDISNIRGTGEKGRIVIADIREYLSRRQAPEPASTGDDKGSPEADVIEVADPVAGAEVDADEVAGKETVTRSEEPEKPLKLIPDEVIYGDPENEIIEMDRMRRLIARHMSYSKKVSPHVNSFIETDVTDLVFRRTSIKEKYLAKHGQKLTITPMILTAVIRALKEYPRINVSVDGEKIILKKSINLGVAAALLDGNLIVPVIRDADKLSFHSLVFKVNDLAYRSRNSQLLPGDIRGGTFTVTNIGPFGSTTGTPIINQPEAAILALGAIKKKPAVVETEEGEAIGIRHIMIMCLTYDHRVIDGALGGMFLKRISDILEKELPEIDI